MIHLTRKVTVSVLEQEKYKFDSKQHYHVVGTSIVTIFTRNNDSGEMEKKTVDCFLIPNDEGQLRNVFVSSCRIFGVE